MVVTISHPVFANVSELRGSCPPPFLDASKFTGLGHVDGRLCSPVAELIDRPTCCLPCPSTDWFYDPSFVTWYTVAAAISAIGLAMCLFLMISWAVLPPIKTRRHYLSICLVAGIIMEAFAFVIPLGVKPAQCYDQITPNDMYTNLTCAFSGAFIVGGGLVVTVWALIRSLSMHLQICWDIVPGQWFFYASQGLGWGIAAVLFTVTMTITGVSFRFGDTCHVNANNSMGDFWGPLLGLSIAAALIQILTFLYCIRVYLRNVFNDNRTETNGSSGLPSYHSSSVRTASAKAVYQRVKKVLWLQWRSIMIIFFLLTDIIFFAIVWVQMDNTLLAVKAGDIQPFMPFLNCLLQHADDRDKCFSVGQKALVNEATALAILMLLSLTGVQTAFMMVRRSMFTGWYDFFKAKFRSKREFVSLDAKAYQNGGTGPKDAFGHPSQFELAKMGSPSVADDSSPPIPHEVYDNAAHFPRNLREESSPTPERPYRKPTMSFSGPRDTASVNTASRPAQWSHEEPDHARGGLASHPPNISRSPPPSFARNPPSFSARRNYEPKAG